MLQSLGLQRVGHDLATKRQQQKDTPTEFSLHALQLKTNRQKRGSKIGEAETDTTERRNGQI